jgi:hypothetical protein
VVIAAEKIIEKGKRIAAHIMEAAPGDIEYADGEFLIAGTDRKVDLTEVAKTAFQKPKLPADIEPGLYERGDFGPDLGATFPNGAHMAEIEIDSETGKVELIGYWCVDDAGTILNPLLFDGQIHGGIAQGVGQILMEDVNYDPDTGQLLSGSFMDYAVPRADDFCHFNLAANEVPTDRNPLGAKGVGEAGTVGAMPAVMNAISNALHRIGAEQVEMPATPEKVWQAIQNGSGTPYLWLFGFFLSDETRFYFEFLRRRFNTILQFNHEFFALHAGFNRRQKFDDNFTRFFQKLVAWPIQARIDRHRHNGRIELRVNSGNARMKFTDGARRHACALRKNSD